MKQKLLLISLILSLVLMGFASSNVTASSGIAAYYVGPGEGYVAMLDGADRKIINNTTSTLFIPARTLAEQQSFLTNTPYNVCVSTKLTWENSAHFGCDCIQLGGIVFDTPNTPSTSFCRYAASAAPSGWTQAANWQRYEPDTWGGDYCNLHRSIGPSTFSNQGATSYSKNTLVLQRMQVCSAAKSYWHEAPSENFPDGSMWTVTSVDNPSTNRVEIGIY